MAVETVLLALLGLVAVWLVIDAGRERHRLRARAAPTASSVPTPNSWRYWPMTLPSADDTSSGPRL